MYSVRCTRHYAPVHPFACMSVKTVQGHNAPHAQAKFSSPLGLHCVDTPPRRWVSAAPGSAKRFDGAALRGHPTPKVGQRSPSLESNLDRPWGNLDLAGHR